MSKQRDVTSFSYLQLAGSDGGFSFQTLRKVSHESFIFISSTFRFWGTSSTKASFSHLQVFNIQILRDVSHESFAFTSSACRLWRKFCTKALFSHLQRSDFEGILARKFHFHIFNVQILRDVSHESFAFTSSACRLWGKSRTKASFSHLQRSDFEGHSRTKASLSHLQLSDFERKVLHESFVFTSSTLQILRDLSHESLALHIFSFQTLRDGSHESFVFTSSAFRLWGKSRRKGSFSHLQLSDFEGCLARKLRFHIFNVQILRDVSHESFAFTSSACRLWRKFCTKASFSHLQRSDFEGHLARKLRFHIFSFQTFRQISHESSVFTSSARRLWGTSHTKASLSHLQLADSEGSPARKLRFQIFRFWGMSRTKASLPHLQLSDCEGRLARKLRFHIFNVQILRDVSHERFVFHIFSFQTLREVAHESFVFTSSTFRFSGKSRTKASFSHLQLSDSEESLARKLCCHIFNIQILRDISQESFVFLSSTFRFWGTSRTKASFSHLQRSDFEGCLARKLRIHISSFQTLREVSHKSFAFTSSTFRFWGTSRTKASFAHLQCSDFEGCLARKVRFHIFSLQTLREVLHKSFIFTSSTFRFWGTSRTKASHSRL